MQPDALDPGVVEQIIPLGDSIITAVFTLLTALVTYGIGRGRQKAEVDNLKAEKKSIEAASGVSTADAAKVISEAAAATVQPLIERIKEQREENKFLEQKNVEYRLELETLRTTIAKFQAENELMRNRFKLQGESPPELPQSDGL